jgi:hypothetical protein
MPSKATVKAFSLPLMIMALAWALGHVILSMTPVQTAGRPILTAEPIETLAAPF